MGNGDASFLERIPGRSTSLNPTIKATFNLLSPLAHSPYHLAPATNGAPENRISS